MQNDTTFGFEAPEESPGFMLWQTTVLWQRLIKKALEPFNIAHSHHVILAILLWFEEHRQTANQVTIVNWSKLDKMTVSNALKTLTTQELVLRAEHEVDTRAKRVTLTPKGRLLARQLVPLVESIDESFFGSLTQQERHNFTKMLGRLIKENAPDET